MLLLTIESWTLTASIQHVFLGKINKLKINFFLRALHVGFKMRCDGFKVHF